MEPQANPTEPKLTSSDVHEPFHAGCQRGELVFTRCSTCGHAQLAAFRVCTACGGSDLSAEVSKGRGTVASFTIVHRAPSDFFKARAPYILALIDLDEGFRAMMGVADGGEPAIGARVSVDISGLGPTGEPLPRARIEGGGS
jgi:uncharacterized OB-fold protein